MSAEASGGLAYAVTGAFVAGRVDLAPRPDALAPGWRYKPGAAAEALTARAVDGFGPFSVVA